MPQEIVVRIGGTVFGRHTIYIDNVGSDSIKNLCTSSTSNVAAVGKECISCYLLFEAWPISLRKAGFNVASKGIPVYSFSQLCCVGQGMGNDLS